MIKWLYRLESIDPFNGLWYDSFGEYCWGIGEIKGCETKYLPMDYDHRYQKDGRKWYSSCSNPDDLPHWYSFEDALNLINKGFRFRKYLATEFVEYPLETTFIKDSCICYRDLSVEEIKIIMRSESNQ